MRIAEARNGLLRTREGDGAEVRPIELFFDLVFVLAVTQLTHHLLGHLSWRGAGETLLLLMAVWSAWIYTSWITNWLDPASILVRVMLIGLMFGSLIMSATLPDAFGSHGLGFATAYVAIQVGRTAFALAAVGRGHLLTGTFLRSLIWFVASGLLWIAGAFVDGDGRVALWAMAVALDYIVVGFGFPVPGLGHSHTSDWMIAGAHLAHRSYLFVILALGESILVIGSDFSASSRSVATICAFIVAFVGSVTLWWLYFDRDEEDGVRAISTASDPGRLGLFAYSYMHVPIVAGIIVAAAADEFTIARPEGQAGAAATALILGGPALYLAGNALFRWALWDAVPWSRLIAIAVLAAFMPLAPSASPLLLLTAATLVVLAVAGWDLADRLFARRAAAEPQQDAGDTLREIQPASLSAYRR